MLNNIVRRGENCNSLMSKDFLHILWARGKVGSDRPTHEKLRACVIGQCSYKHLQDYDLPSVLGREVDLTVAST